ncbi:protection of telomeres protein 1b isoform X2 [Morus notabilis]|uniref:protection of telomeres protein 1b isoform X2 n=1 Tax=Morus notabilis TaxID=981085 RepID=UPI000CED564D|nr:protection of telomeres protein 1b isoform X2 [Morus notabilis]
MAMRNEGRITTIREALAASEMSRTPTLFNLGGLVIEFSFPRKSHGSGSKLKAHVFTNSIHHLPRIRSSNPLLLLTHIQIKKHGNDVYAVYNKKYSSFALFDPKANANNCTTPYQASPGFDIHSIDTTHIQSIFDFSLHYQLVVEKNEYLISLKDLGRSEYFDLLCQVVHIENVGAEDWMLFVWDGTDAPPLHLESNLAEDDPLLLEPAPCLLNVSTLRKFPCVGSVLRVRAHVDISMHAQGMGQWVKIRNMTYETHSGLWLGRLLPTTKLMFLPDNEPTVLECKRAMDERGLGKEGRLPFWSNPLPALTVIDSSSFPFATLMDLITQAEDEITVRCVVRVVAVSPFDVEKFCFDGRNGIILTLDDPTARIHASLNGHDGGMFFEDISSDTFKRRKMDELLGISSEENTNPHRNPPWIQCCIKLDASRFYSMCHTKLVAS